MRKASNRLLDSRLFPFTGEDAALVQNLKTVAQAFVQLQEKRHIADYDNGVTWTPIESLREVTTASKAFQVWASIRDENIAQEYLVSLLIKPRDQQGPLPRVDRAWRPGP